jgi:hypothetical protein
MARRLVIGLLALTAVVCAQRRVDPKNTYIRVIGVVSMIGRGTPDDPRRPQYAPWPATSDPNGISGFFFQPSDDGKYAVVELVSRTRSALQTILSDKSIKVFEEGKLSKAAIESAVKPYRKDFDLSKFGMVMP